MVWTNYMSPCSSIVGLYLKGTCDVISVTMAQKCPLNFSFCKLSEKLIRWPTIFIYLLESSLNYLTFQTVRKKNCPVELNIFKENAFYGLQKILLDNFPGNFYIWSGIVNGTCMQKITELNFELKANVSRRFYFRFARFYAAFNFRWAYFDSFSWRVYLGVDCDDMNEWSQHG